MTEAEGRYEIFMAAYGQLNGHYLRGARGGLPGGPAVLERTVHALNRPEWDHLAVSGAYNSCGRCYGRWARFGASGYLFQPDSARLKRLKDWVYANQKYPVASWPPFEHYGMTPRRLSKKEGATIAMGEDCRSRLHFDCIGFIFWALNQVVPRSRWVKNAIPQYEWGFKGLERLGLIAKSQLKNGDIVTRTNTNPDHIGIANEEGWVVHASRECDGVVYEPFERGNWTSVSRVSTELFTG